MEADFDQSFQVGRFVGIARKMEMEIHTRDGLVDAPSRVENRLNRFVEIPSDTLDTYQIELINAQIQLKELECHQLIEDIRKVFYLIDIAGLTEKKLNYNGFMEGYHQQLDSYEA